MALKTVLITQARSGSSRLPGKILKEIEGKSLLEIHLERLSQCKNVSSIIVATTDKEEDLIIYNQAKKWGYEAYRGSELDVLDRFYQSVKNRNPDWIVRVTSDCPLIDPILVDNIIEYTQEHDVDYGSNGLSDQFPDGQDVEVFKFSVLEMAWKNAKLKSEREHVTPYIRNNSNNEGARLFKILSYPSDSDYSKIRMTVDEHKDFDLIEILIKKLGTSKTWLEYTNYIIDNNLSTINGDIIRNEGLIKSLKNDN